MSKIEYISVEEASKLWGLSIRSVRNYCAQGRVPVKNQVGGTETVRPEDVATEMKALIADYNSKSEITFDDILDFHVRFESIHPFQDGQWSCRPLNYVQGMSRSFYHYRKIKDVLLPWNQRMEKRARLSKRYLSNRPGDAIKVS